MIRKKKGSALRHIKNLIIDEEAAAVPEPTGDENPDLDAVSNHSATPLQEDSHRS